MMVTYLGEEMFTFNPKKTDKMKSTYFFILIIFCFQMIACKSNEANSENTTEATSTTYTNEWAKSFLDSANIVFSQQLASGDSNGLAAQYWPDAELLFSHMGTVKGPDILGSWGGMIRGGLTNIKFTTTDVVNDENFIIETETYAVIRYQ